MTRAGVIMGVMEAARARARMVATAAAKAGTIEAARMVAMEAAGMVAMEPARVVATELARVVGMEAACSRTRGWRRSMQACVCGVRVLVQVRVRLTSLDVQARQLPELKD